MDPTRTVELLWGLREPWTGGGPKPTLSIEQIARTAVDIADAEGFDAVTMQRVAGQLDYTKMALYRYVASKNELIAAMIEAAVGDPPDLTLSGAKTRSWCWPAVSYVVKQLCGTH